MKKLIVALICWSAVAWSAAASSATPPQSAQAVLDAVDAIRSPGPDFGFALDVTYSRPDKEDQKFGFDVRVRGRTNSLVRYTAPPTDAGKKLLLMGQNMWIYIPGTRRAIRISAQQQLLGQVSNADVARVVFSIDYEPETTPDATSNGMPNGVKAEQFEGTDVYLLTLKAKDQGSPYQRIELRVAQADLHPLEARFFALSGRLMKSVRYQDYQEVEGKARPMQLEVVDAVKEGERTLMRYSQFRVVDTPETWFQPDFLPRLD